MSEGAVSVSSPAGPRAIRLSPVGRHTRFMLAAYLRHIFIVTTALLAIALTIDLWPQFHDVASHDGDGAFASIWSIMRYSALRTPGLVAPFFPFAIFLGVVWTEVAHTSSRERMLVWNSGRSPLHCLVPVVLLGVLLGVFEFTTDAILGPAAMAVQMHERFGLDGERLDRTRRGDSHCIASTSGLIDAQIEYGPPPVLHELTFYRRDSQGQLTEVDIAAVAHQVPGTEYWVLSDGRYWTPPSGGKGGAETALAYGSSDEPMVPFKARTVRLNLDPLWLSVFGMETQYLPLSLLRPLARNDTGPLSKGLYRTRLQVLYGEVVLPGAMALLAASMSMLFLAYAVPWMAVVGIVFAGYIAHFGTKACLMMGQNGYMPPLMAGWLVPAALLVSTLVVMIVIERQRRGSGSRMRRWLSAW